MPLLQPWCCWQPSAFLGLYTNQLHLSAKALFQTRFHVDMNAWRTLFKQSTHPESGWNAESTEPTYFCRIWKL